MVATRRGERDECSICKTPRVSSPHASYETLVTHVDGGGVPLVGPRDARRESSGGFQAFGDETLHEGPSTDGPEILDGSVFVMAQADDRR